MTNLLTADASFAQERQGTVETLLKGMKAEGGNALRSSFERLIESSFNGGGLWMALRVNEFLARFREDFPNCLCDKDGRGSHAQHCPLIALELAMFEIVNAAQRGHQ
jgi:hypothetical protein